MFELLRSPWDAQFDTLLTEATHSLVVSSPYIGRGPCDRVRQHVQRLGSPTFELSVLTDLSRDNMLCGATDVQALAGLAGAVPQATIRFLPSLHAKVYVADERRAIVTSGNLTDSGLLRNFEYGVLFTAPEVVRAIRSDVVTYAALGSPIDAVQLNIFASIVTDLKRLRVAAEQQLRSRMRREFDERLRDVDDRILSARAAGRTAHSIFADAILHLLRQGPLKTTEIHGAIRRIHPDLCDDSLDLVINGQHFGKKWKHGVRTAQVFLRRRGDIHLLDDRWCIRSTAPIE
jgi:hypothetical protein